MKQPPIIGRKKEISATEKYIDQAEMGSGNVLLLAGEAGTGKTRFARGVGEKSSMYFISVATNETATPPYGLFIDIFRDFLRTHPDGFDKIGPLKPFLSYILPELGDSPSEDDPNSLYEVIRLAIEAITTISPTIILLDDLQWADNASLELIPRLAEWIKNLPILILGIYRSDEIPRGHLLRKIKNDLRRANNLNEINIEALSQTDTIALSNEILNSKISPQLAEIIFYKTQGVPFFIEELIETMEESEHLKINDMTVELASNDNIPIPENVKDAILIRFDKLTPKAKEYLEVASVVGQEFTFELMSKIINHESTEEAFQKGFITKKNQETVLFNHALTREAIYNEISWSRVRKLHRDIAEYHEETNGSPQMIAEHWSAAKEPINARNAYIKVVNISCGIHAYLDASMAAKNAINLWPVGESEMERLALVDQLGYCAQISGSLSEAAKAFREAAESYLTLEAYKEYADTKRKLATVFSLQGNWAKSISAHQDSSEAFLKVGDSINAIKELISLISQLHSAGNYHEAIPFAENALAYSKEINEEILILKSMGLLGSLKSRIGSPKQGLEMIREGLSKALEKNLYSTASELYLRLGGVMEHVGNYDEAQDTYNTGRSYCETHNLSPLVNLCQACVSVIAFQTGDFQQVYKLNNEVISSEKASSSVKTIAKTFLGMAQGYMGNIQNARENLIYSLSDAKKLGYLSLVVVSNWGLAVLESFENNQDSAKKYLIDMLAEWENSDESHYSIPALRFASTFFNSIGDGENTRACANALSTIATTISSFESLSGLAHSLGEVAWNNNDFPGALEYFENATSLLSNKKLPLEEAESNYRAGIVCIEMGDQEKGVEYLISAFKLLHPLGEKFYSDKIIGLLEENGHSLDTLIGKRKATKAKYSGLTKRQLEVLKLVATGMTNQEIADELYLSIRTVDMHLRNILAEFGSRSRTEAVSKAVSIGLLTRD